MSHNRTHQIEVLQRFEKPDIVFLKDKECLICLESLESDINQIVKLPCWCANSAYHIPCIIQLLQSGENKNFCPHCKTKYTIFVEHVVPTQQLPNNILLLQIEEARQAREFSQTMLVHLLSNTTMNIVNLCGIRSYPTYNTEHLFPVLVMLYFLKIFINVCMFLYSKTDVYKIQTGLFFSYLYQAITFGWLVFALSGVKNDSLSIILLVNNLFLGLADLAFRVFVEYRMNARVTDDV